MHSHKSIVLIICLLHTKTPNPAISAWRCSAIVSPLQSSAFLIYVNVRQIKSRVFSLVFRRCCCFAHILRGVIICFAPNVWQFDAPRTTHSSAKRKRKARNYIYIYMYEAWARRIVAKVWEQLSMIYLLQIPGS